jgi:hypothetical protein
MLLGGLVAGMIPALAQSGNSNFPANAAGRMIASEYGKWSITTLNAVAAGTSTVTFAPCFIHAGTSNRMIFPFWQAGAQALNVPISVLDGSNSENISVESAATFPAAAPVSYAQPFTCSFAASFANAHSAGVTITSGDSGLAEAMNDAISQNIGTVSLDGTFTGSVAAALVYPNVQIEDLRSPVIQYWNPTPANATNLAAPTTLVSTTAFSSTTVAGSASYAAGTIHVCIAYVDILGNEGPCSADYSFTDTSAKAIQFTAPAASVGAVGWIPYIGLESGASAHEYQVALVTQPTVIGVAPVPVAGLCTLTTIETVTPACALANTAYGTSGSGAVVAAYPVVTSPLVVGQGGLSTASYYIGDSNSRTVYSYVPSSTPALAGIEKSSNAFTITTAAASTVPQVMGTLAIPPGFMNYVGRSIRVCGEAYSSTQGASTVVAIKFEWDAHGRACGLPPRSLPWALTP